MEIRSEKVVANLKKLMSDAGLNQRQTALKSKIDPSYFNRVMKLKTGLGMAIAEKLAQGLGCTTDEIFLEKIQDKPSPTVTALLKALEEIQNEIDQIKSHPLHPYLEKATEQQIAFVKKYLSESALDEARKISKPQAEKSPRRKT